MTKEKVRSKANHGVMCLVEQLSELGFLVRNDGLLSGEVGAHKSHLLVFMKEAGRGRSQQRVSQGDACGRDKETSWEAK